MYPIRFEPIYHSYIWGGDRICKRFHRKNSIVECAESWEIADRLEGISVAANGPWKGIDLRSLIRNCGEDLLGKGRKEEIFPLLIKLIDAQERLSLQVHPDVESAKILGGEPKEEAWVVLEGGDVFAGLHLDVGPKQLLESLQEGAIEKVVRQIFLKEGEAIHVPAGCVHAVGAGCLFLEIQQNSNTTYRLHDWGRKGRSLHIEEAIRSIRWDGSLPIQAAPVQLASSPNYLLERLVSSPFFIVERIQVIDCWEMLADPKTFQIFFVLKGEGIISVDQMQENIYPGETYLIPAKSSSIRLEGAFYAIRIYLP